MGVNRDSERIPRRFCLAAVLARRGLRGASKLKIVLKNNKPCGMNEVTLPLSANNMKTCFAPLRWYNPGS